MQPALIARVTGRGLARSRNGSQAFVARLHGGSGPSGGGVKDADALFGRISSGKHPRGAAGWMQEHSRAPTPLFLSPSGGSGSLLGSSGVVRGLNSSGKKNSGKDDSNDGSKDKKCCDKDHGESSGAGASSSDDKSVLQTVLTDDDEGSFDITSHPIWQKESISYLLENNRRWVAQKTAQDPEFFTRLASVHKPEFLFIGCSDARLSVQHMLGLEAGELFVHRNVANMVMHTDLNLLTVLTYAVDYLKVKHIIVCGHYDCGGVRAAMRNHDHGLIENWIMGVRDVARLHRKELKALDGDEAIHRRLVELNVQEQCVKLYANPVVQKSQARDGFPNIHAMVFDVGQGLVKELDIDFKEIIRKYRHVYSMYDFKKPQ